MLSTSAARSAVLLDATGGCRIASTIAEGRGAEGGRCEADTCTPHRRGRRDRGGARRGRDHSRPGSGAGGETGADFRGRSLLAQTAAQSLGDRLDDRPVGRRPGQRVDDSSAPAPSRTTSRPPTSWSAMPEGGTTKRSLAPRRHAGRPRRRRSASAARWRRRCSSTTRPATLVKSWGGPGEGYDWPDSNHGITVDSRGQRVAGGQRRQGHPDPEVHGAGKFLFQIGKHGVHNGSNDTENFWQPTKIWDDAAANEMYVADGYGNRRVIVFDVATGKYKRHWGAYGDEAERRADAGLQPEGAAVEAVQHRALRHRLERRLRLRVRPRQRSHSGVPQGRHVRAGSVHRHRTRSGRARCGT